MSVTYTVQQLADTQDVHCRTLFGPTRTDGLDLNPTKGLVSRVVELEAARSETEWGLVGEHPLDSFAGSNDDAKLDAFETYAKAQTYKPILRLPNRLLHFTKKRPLWRDLRIAGPDAWNNPQLGETGMTVGIKLGNTGDVGWWDHATPDAMYGVTMKNLSFVTASQGRFLTTSGTGHLFTLQLHGISCNGLKSLLGTYAKRLAMTGGFFTGPWNMANSYEIHCHLAGSDSRLWMDGAFVDTHPNYATSQGFSGRPQLWFDWLDKSVVGPLFVTCEGPWEGVWIDGPPIGGGRGNANAGELECIGWRVEGRNPTQPCNSVPIRVRGGTVRFRGLGTGWAKSHLIDHSGGRLFIDGWNLGRLRERRETESLAAVGISTGNAEVQVRDTVEALRTARSAAEEATHPVFPPRWELRSGARTFVDPLQVVTL